MTPGTARRPLRVGGRRSALSSWQLAHVASRLRALGLVVDIDARSASGDRDLETAIEALPSAAPFVDEIEEALLAGEIDVAVHSLKDLPVHGHEALRIAALVPRGAVAETLVAHRGLPLDALPAGAVVGTSSTRRRLQLHLHRPDLACRPIRGPVDARLAQVQAGHFDAAILALAGLERLDLADAASQVFPVESFLPAPGQGAIVLQVRSADTAMGDLLAPLDHAQTRRATDAERELERLLEGADYVVAAHAIVEGPDIVLRSRLLARDGVGVADALVHATDPGTAAGLASAHLTRQLGTSGIRA